MHSFILIVLSIFAGAQCQIFAPYPRAVPAMVPSCPCGNPAPVPLPVPVPVPGMLPGRPCANPPLPAIVPACGCGNPAPLPVLKTPLGYEPAFNPVIEAPLPLSLAIGNPFLPAASPVSALAPFSPLLPPANTCSRCQYLKKIPIPPPCI